MTAAPQVVPKPGGQVGARKEAIAGYAFVAVPMAFFLILQIGVLFYAGYISLWNWNIRSGPIEFLGLGNFQRLLGDPIFLTAVKNTVYYTVVWVPLTMAVGLFLAVIVNQKIRGQTFFRASFYFPAIASSAAITILWIFLVSPSGLFNELRGALGLNPLFQFLGYGPNQNWIGDYRTALNSVIILNAWTTSGTFMLFYLASLQSISREVYEAAAIDGAGPWQAFWKITFPLLRPGHFFVATVGVIGGLQMFDQARIAGGTDGAPAYSLMTIVLYLYNALIRQIDPGYAAAVGLVLFVVILGATLLQRRLFGGDTSVVIEHMDATVKPTTVTSTPAAVAPVGDKGRGWRRKMAYVLLIGYALLMFLPFAWTVITSFKTLPDSTRLTFIPQPFTTAAWEYALTNLTPSVLVLFWNSLMLATIVTLSNVVLGSLAGYAFARLRFRGREILFLIVLATLMIPDQLRLVPVYILFNGLGLTVGIGEYVAVILLLAVSATSIFLLRQYFLTIPRDLEEAAKIDGAGFFTTFWRVMLPLATPALAAVTILQFQGTWNGFFWPIVFLKAEGHLTLPIGLTFFREAGGFSTNWPPLMATVVIATIPILILYIFFQRYFVEGIAASGVKG